MKKIKIIALTLTLFACNTSEQTSENSQAEKTTQAAITDYENKNFFNFDAIDYYELEFKKELDSKFEQKPLTENEELVNTIIGTGLFDTTLITKLDKTTALKTKIDSTYFDQINEVFKFRKVKENERRLVKSCKAAYKDILVFKHKLKTIGIANICFSCGQYKIMGSKIPTSTFGKSGEFSMLNEILKN